MFCCSAERTPYVYVRASAETEVVPAGTGQLIDKTITGLSTGSPAVVVGFVSIAAFATIAYALYVIIKIANKKK